MLAGHPGTAVGFKKMLGAKKARTVFRVKFGKKREWELESGEVLVVTLQHERKPLPVVLAEEALVSCGARAAEFEEREVEHGSWFADWDGELVGSDVYIGLMGGAPKAEAVRILLDDWTFEQVAAGDVGSLLTRVFSGQATLSRQKFLFFSSSHLLEVEVGSSTYSAGRDTRSDDELAPWERALTAV